MHMRLLHARTPFSRRVDFSGRDMSPLRPSRDLRSWLNEWTQVNRHDDPDVILVSVLRHAIGYAAARSLRYRSRIFDDGLGWGEQRDHVPRQALRHLAARQAAFAVAFLLLAGFVARSLSATAQTSMTTVAG